MSIDQAKDVRLAQPVLPLAIMPKGRKCLVVGAGKTGYRKVLSLLEAGGKVTVIAPEAIEDLSLLLTGGQVEWRRRHFMESDPEGAFIVFAATNDPQTNSAVLAAAQRRGVLCGIVDNGWRDGDFISPAVLRQAGLTVAVSTGGRSCRRSRMIKNSLARHIDSAIAMDLVVLGVSHENLALDRREHLHLRGKRLDQVGEMLKQVWGLHEFAWIETCNRIELHAIISSQPATEPLLNRILDFDRLDSHERYTLRGAAAFRHTSVLLAGLLSQISGEYHIVAQVKDAYEAAEGAGWASGMMKEWLSSSLHVSKDIRASTRSLFQSSEIEDTCLDYLADHLEDTESMGIAVLGSGSMGRCVVEVFVKRYAFARLVWVYHSNKPRIPETWSERIRLVGLDSLREELSRVNAVICAVSGPERLLQRDDASVFAAEREIRIVDLGVPRNVAPDLDESLPNIHVVDLDGLKDMRGRKSAAMAEILRKADRIVDEHQNMYEKMLRGLSERF